MTWLIGFGFYALALIAVVVIASGRKRGDVRHAETIQDLAALEAPGPVRVDPKRARVRVRASGTARAGELHRNVS